MGLSSEKAWKDVVEILAQSIAVSKERKIDIISEWLNTIRQAPKGTNTTERVESIINKFYEGAE